MMKRSLKPVALAISVALIAASTSLAQSIDGSSQAPDTAAALSVVAASRVVAQSDDAGAPNSVAVSDGAGAPNTASAPNTVAGDAPETVKMGHFNVPSNIGGKNLLKVTVTQTDKPSPLLHGSVQTIPTGTKVDFAVVANINSEISQKGDEIEMQIAGDVKDASGKKVIIPGGWRAIGYVNRSQGSRRLDREGYVEIEFDRIVSPDGQTVVDFPAKVSTKDSLMKSTVKQVITGSKFVGIGAFAGAQMAYQFGGLGTAISTYGISIGAGAAVGGTIGLVAKLKKKGDIASFYPGDVLTLKTAEPIFLPGFDPTQLPSAQAPPKLAGLNVVVSKHRFNNVPWGDKAARHLTVDVAVRNDTKSTLFCSEICVQSEKMIQPIYPDLGSMSSMGRTIKPGTSQNVTLTYLVASPKYKYSLVLYKGKKEVFRVPIN